MLTPKPTVTYLMHTFFNYTTIRTLLYTIYYYTYLISSDQWQSTVNCGPPNEKLVIFQMGVIY